MKSLATHQQELHEHQVLGPVLPAYVCVAGGRFIMGSDEPGFSEGPAHEVFVSSFWCARTVTTNVEFAGFIAATGYRTTAERADRKVTWSSFATRGRDFHPVVMMSWYDAAEYARWLASRTGLPFRLPTEAEWEKAARGGRIGSPYPWGDDAAEVVGANFGHMGRAAIPRTAVVDAVPANRLGIRVGGNVWEWVRDWFDPDAYTAEPRHDPTGPVSGAFRVRRGGAFNNRRAFRLRVASRNRLSPSATFGNMGFRLVCNEDPTSSLARAQDRCTSLRVLGDAAARRAPADDRQWNRKIELDLHGKITLRERLEAVLNVLRPNMEEDRGGVSVESVVGGNVTLRMRGTCRDCPKSNLTFHDLAATLRYHLPEVSSVERAGD